MPTPTQPERKPALKPNPRAVEAFGDVSHDDRPREFVGGFLKDLPDPPDVPTARAVPAVPSTPAPATTPTKRRTKRAAPQPNEATPPPAAPQVPQDPDAAVLFLLNAAFDSLAVSLSVLGLTLSPAARQSLADSAVAFISGAAAPGGTLARRL